MSTIATVSCTNPACGHRGQWHHVPDTIDGPLHCGGCFTVLHCEHLATVTTTRYTGTLAAPLLVSATSCTRCHHVIAKTQTPTTLDQIPLEVIHTAVG